MARSLSSGDPAIKLILDKALPSPPSSPSQLPLAQCHDGKGASSTRNRPHPIAEAFHKTTIYLEERSLGNCDDTVHTALTDLTILAPQGERSKHQAYWDVRLNHLLDEGWRLCYTDGTGREGQVGAGVYSHDRRGNPLKTYRAFGGSISSVADGERLAIALALEEETSNMIALVSDSQAAIHTVHNLSKGQPPRSHIEIHIKNALKSKTRDIGILWVRGHIGIAGNEKGDKRAEYESILGEISGTARTATEEGVRAISRATRKTHRQQPGFNARSCEWNRHALSAYTWTRTERGPQNKWLHHIKEVDSPACACGSAEETGHRLVIECPRHERIRREFLRGKGSWEELDEADWRKVEEGDDG